MKRLFASLLCLMLALFPAYGVGEEIQDTDLQTFLTELAQGENLDALYARLDASMQAALSPEDFASLWSQLSVLGGEFLGFDGDTETAETGAQDERAE